MKIYKVYFTNPSKRTSREIGKGRNLKKAERVVYRFLEEKHYTSPYWRFSYDKNRVWIDVGSWSEFFYIEEEVM